MKENGGSTEKTVQSTIQATELIEAKHSICMNNETYSCKDEILQDATKSKV